MLDNGVDCLTDNGLDELCAVDGSWWYNVRDWDDDWVDPYPAETYCQYTCDQMGLGYPSASPCCAERGSDVNEFYDYGTPDTADADTDVTAAVTSEPTAMPTPEATPEFGDLEVNGDCDGENDEFCALCEGDCDDDIDVSCEEILLLLASAPSYKISFDLISYSCFHLFLSQQCEDGYFCLQRDADEDIPGCNGDAEDGIDYCIPEFYRDN